MASAMQHNDLTLETIASALGALDPNVSRDEWWRIAASLKSELGDKDGFGLFDSWSKTGSNYDARACEDTWKSTDKGGGVNIGTLIYKAQQTGWKFEDDRPRLNAEQVEQRRAAREAEAKAAAAAKRKTQGEAAKLANLLVNEARPAGPMHPYLAQKQVQAHNLLLGEWPLFTKDGEEFRRERDVLMIPIADAKNGKIISLQGFLVDFDGNVRKLYLKNGRKRGGFFMIGRPPEAGEPLVFCEGYATGATIHEMTGWCVIVCFDAANLPVVAEAMRGQFAQAAFIIAADNDAFTRKPDGTPVNPGVDYATRAGEATRGFVIVPQFADLEGEPTDFNDLANREGRAVAHAQLLNNPITSKPGAMTIDAPTGEPANDNPGEMLEPVDWFTPLPDVGMKGKPLATIENLQEILCRLGATARYNMIAKSQEIMIPGEQYLVDNQAGAAMARLKSQCTKFLMPTESMGEFLLYLADKNPFNPVERWITSVPWDGKSRFADLLATASTREEYPRDLWALLLRRWMISAVAAAILPTGFWSKGVLVFQGDQSLGKTAWFRSLLPDDLRQLLKVDATINPDNKDTVISAVSHWLVELGELDGTLRKADIARLKGFISQDYDQFRRPYARAEEKFQRRTVFFASVNPEHFLADDTGNVRWWTIPVWDVVSDHGLDMQQVWAEVYTWFAAGERWWLDRTEEARLESVNAAHQKVEPIEERMQTRLAWHEPTGVWSWMTATEILMLVGVENPTSVDANKAGPIMRKLNGQRARRSNGRNLLLCPPKMGQYSADDDRPF